MDPAPPGIDVTIVGSGRDELDIENGSVIQGNVLFDNSKNTIGSDTVKIGDDAATPSSIEGSLTLHLANSTRSGNHILFGNIDGSDLTGVDLSGAELVVTGPVLITSGAGADVIQALEAHFESTFTVSSGGNPNSTPDQLIVDAATFDAAVSVTMSGLGAEIGVAANTGPIFETTAAVDTVIFNGAVVVHMNGPKVRIVLSNRTHLGGEVTFNSTIQVIGGSGGKPAGTLYVNGPISGSTPLLVNFAESP